LLGLQTTQEGSKRADCPAINGILKEASNVAGDVDDKQVRPRSRLIHGDA
jgi:ferritin-like metal-binding protein YciE